MTWKGSANCRFIIIVQVVAAMFALITIAVQGYFLLKRKSHGTSVPLLFTGLYTVSFTFILVSSCILSAGFKEYCDSWLQSLGERDLNCRAVQRIQWSKASSIKGDRFYDVLSTAQTATWISFSVWMMLPLVAWAGVRFVTNRRHQEPTSDIPT
ncbi:transmembrane protein 179B [Strongylocentrotus purpuratus]|uniref:Uncharacterized protein n=1 Tax=Strongylocentrotus purpuratus TaxID=7668 RepID=A0A7M7SYB6_STRPU|nr:transmembrane protein 179B [Strongylocentrotus purpuratus]